MTATPPALSGSVRVTQADRETVIDKVPVRKAVLMLHRGAVDLVEADDRYRIGLWPKPLIVATSIVSLSAVMDWRRYERTGAVSYSRDALRLRLLRTPLLERGHDGSRHASFAWWASRMDQRCLGLPEVQLRQGRSNPTRSRHAAAAHLALRPDLP